MRVSHETIYRSIYVQAENLRRELHTCLRTGSLRKPQLRPAEHLGRIRVMVNTYAHPITDRALPDLGGDLIFGSPLGLGARHPG